MARRRMFSLDVVDSDYFLDMPSTSQNLYFHLGMRADDEGFVASPKRVAKNVNATDDDMKILVAKGFLIPFESGVCVITHWARNNYIQADRFKASIYSNERNSIEEQDGVYLPCIQDVSSTDTQVRLGKDRLGKDREDYVSSSRPTIDEVIAYCKERNNTVDPRKWFDHYTANGWKVGRSTMKDWKAAVRTWERSEYNKPRSPVQQTKGTKFDPSRPSQTVEYL